MTPTPSTSTNQGRAHVPSEMDENAPPTVCLPSRNEGKTDMNGIRAARPIPIGLTGLVVLLIALVVFAVANSQSAQALGNEHEHANAPAAVAHPPASATQKQIALREGMRLLWEDHIVWTRLAVISLTTGTPDTDATVARLLKNQTDIGNAVKPFYGKAAGKELTRQLTQHILIAADLIAAAKAGDQAKLAEESARWQRNADAVAGVLNSVNPRYFNLAALKAEMRMHLKLTTEEVVARLQGKWVADVAAYDKIHRHILHMSDYLSDGIVKQFPARFR